MKPTLVLTLLALAACRSPTAPKISEHGAPRSDSGFVLVPPRLCPTSSTGLRCPMTDSGFVLVPPPRVDSLRRIP